MERSTISRLSLGLFLVAVSTSSVTPITIESPEAYLKANRGIALTAAGLVALAYFVKPPKNSEIGYSYTIEAFNKNFVTALRNAFGWRKKEPKWKNKNGKDILDPGYEEQGFVGLMSNCGNVVITVSSLMVLLKAIEPAVKWGELLGFYDIEKPAKS